MGFSVRRETSNLDKKMGFVRNYFLSLKQGFKMDRKVQRLDGLADKVENKKKQTRGHVEEMCKARISLKKNDVGKRRDCGVP